jgi:putative protease
MNTFAVKFWSKFDYKWTYPLELNRKELKHLPLANEMLIYGRIPVMLSANCINKTLSKCNQKSSSVFLTDRMNKNFPIKMDCKYCYNIMYNSLPLSLHNYLHEINKGATFRIEFTIETEKECDQICSAYLNNSVEKNTYETIRDYTNGHYKRGVD